MILWYTQGTKNKGLVLNSPKIMVVYCYVGAYFEGLWIHKNPQDPIYDKSMTIFMVKFSNSSSIVVIKAKDIDLYF